MKILLLGASKTGTTAMAYAVQKCFKDHELIFEPKRFDQIDFDNSNLIVKSLFVKRWQEVQKYLPQFDKVLIIVRHPYDRLISQLLYNPFNGLGFSDDRLARKYINLLKKKTDNPDAVPLVEIIELLKEITSADLEKDSLETCRAILKLHEAFTAQVGAKVIRYEDFIDKNLEHIDSYLGSSLSNQEDIEVGADHQYVARKKAYGDWKNWFTESDVSALLKKFDKFNGTFGYSSVLDGSYKQVIAPEHSHLYTASVINKYRKQNFLPAYSDQEINLKKEGRLFDRAINVFRKQEFLRSRKLVEEAITIRPDFVAAHILLSKIHARDNQYGKAKRCLDKALEMGKKSDFVKGIPDHLSQLSVHFENRAKASIS